MIFILIMISINFSIVNLLNALIRAILTMMAILIQFQSLLQVMIINEIFSNIVRKHFFLYSLITLIQKFFNMITACLLLLYI